jgi:hypothetical protein
MSARALEHNLVLRGLDILLVNHMTLSTKLCGTSMIFNPLFVQLGPSEYIILG